LNRDDLQPQRVKTKEEVAMKEGRLTGGEVATTKSPPGVSNFHPSYTSPRVLTDDWK
jgi:hypothetical protein